MARIKIKDLPKETKVSKEEMRKVLGGILLASTRQTKITSGLAEPALANFGYKSGWAEPALA